MFDCLSFYFHLSKNQNSCNFCISLIYLVFDGIVCCNLHSDFFWYVHKMKEKSLIKIEKGSTSCDEGVKA